MTEGKWFGITITEFAYLLGFDEEDLGRMKIHRDHDMDKVDMKFMYIPGQEWNLDESIARYHSMHTCTACLERHLLLGKGTNQMCQTMKEIC
jgi:hypothetical protein